MKLKRLLSGVTAAIMAFSAVAITSFTTASAALEPIKPTKGWYGGGETGTLEGSQLKLIQDYNGATAKFSAIQNKKFYVAFEVTGATANTTAYICLNNGSSVQAWDPGDKNPAISTPKNGKYVATFEGNDSDVTQFMAVVFKNDGEDDYGITSAKLIGCYLEDPTDELGDIGGGDDPDPSDAAKVRLIDNNGTQLGDIISVNKDGQYEVSATGISLNKQSAVTLRSTGAVKGTLINENATLTVDEVTVNGTSVDVPNALKNISVYGWDAPEDIKVDVYNAWNAAGSIALPADVSTITSISVKFTLKGAEIKKDPTPGPTPSKDKVTAAIYFTDGDYYPCIERTISVDIDKDGQYKLVIPAANGDGTETDVSGIMCLVIDFLDCKNDFSFDAKLDSITVAGKEIVQDASKALFGDLEDDNDNLRLEIYNTWGDTSSVGAPIDPLDVDYKVGEEMVITFTVSNFKKIVRPSNPTNSGRPNPSVTTPTKQPVVKTTRNPKVVAKEKAAAKKAMKQAKLNTLKVKSKAKKKINVTWKKVKKAKGYQVQVSKNKKFKKSKIIFKKDVKKTKLTIKNKKIKSKKTYFVRVRAYATYKDKNGKTIRVYSKWNKKLRKVKVK